MVKVLGDSVAEGHRLHLEALIRQERGVDYQRQDYLSPEWQKSLLRTREQKRRDDDDDAIETATWRKVTPSSSSSSSQQQRESPMSTASSSASLFDFDTSVASSLELCIHWRARIIEWKYQVVDRFDLSREIVSISSFYLDQYLSMYYVADIESIPLPQLFQLVGITSIYLAIKIHSPKKVPMHAITRGGNGHIAVNHIEEMELSIMKSLRWYLSPPTAASFIENLYPLIVNDDIACCRVGVDDECARDDPSYDARSVQSFEFAIFLTELSVCAYQFVPIRPSSIAVAAILYSMEIVGHPDGAREAFQCLLRDDSLAIVVDPTEVKAAGKLLRELYLLSIPDDNKTDVHPDGQ